MTSDADWVCPWHKIPMQSQEGPDTKAPAVPAKPEHPAQSSQSTSESHVQKWNAPPVCSGANIHDGGLSDETMTFIWQDASKCSLSLSLWVYMPFGYLLLHAFCKPNKQTAQDHHQVSATAVISYPLCRWKLSFWRKHPCTTLHFQPRGDDWCLHKVLVHYRSDVSWRPLWQLQL